MGGTSVAEPEVVAVHDGDKTTRIKRYGRRLLEECSELRVGEIAGINSGTLKSQ